MGFVGILDFARAVAKGMLAWRFMGSCRWSYK